MAYVLDVFMADTSSLKNRALVFAFAQTPYIVTTFIGPRAAQSFLETSGWPWGYGTFAIITPLITIPILSVLWINQRKAVKEGLLVKKRSGRTIVQSIQYYFWEFDGESRCVVSWDFGLPYLQQLLACFSFPLHSLSSSCLCLWPRTRQRVINPG